MLYVLIGYTAASVYTQQYCMSRQHKAAEAYRYHCESAIAQRVWHPPIPYSLPTFSPSILYSNVNCCWDCWHMRSKRPGQLANKSKKYKKNIVRLYNINPCKVTGGGGVKLLPGRSFNCSSGTGLPDGRAIQYGAKYPGKVKPPEQGARTSQTTDRQMDLPCH